MFQGCAFCKSTVPIDVTDSGIVTLSKDVRSYRADTKHKRSHAQANARSNSKSSKFAFRSS